MDWKGFVRKEVLQALIAILLSVVASFLVYAIVGFIFTGVQGLYFEPLSKGTLNVIAKLFIAVLFPPFFHFFTPKSVIKFILNTDLRMINRFAPETKCLRISSWMGYHF